MNGLLKHKKSISVILIYVILIQMPGCVSTKIINSVSEIPVSNKYSYILHSQKTRYQILNAGFSNGIISGILIKGEPAHIGYKVHFYLPADSVLKINPDMTLVLPVDRVSKIELERVAIGATAAVIGGVVLLIVIIIGYVSLKNMNLSGVI
jgi:hypothetical protein